MKYSATLLPVIAALAFPAAASAKDVFYVVTNKADGNTIAEFATGADGKYAMAGEYQTGGTGTGDLEIPALQKDPAHPLANGDDPLISANALAASDDGKHIVVVNPGNATLSLMAVGADHALSSVNTVAATDPFPISVAIHGNLVVAASVGKDNGNGSIGLYTIADGKLVAAGNNRRDLMARPSTIDFSADGKFVIVNELVTGKIKTFSVNGGALSADPVGVIDSPRDADDRFHAIPVGFAVRDDAEGDTIIMSEARFLTPDFMLREEAGVVPQSPHYSWQTSSISTYHLNDEGQMSLVSGDVLTGKNVEGDEIANCWVALSPDGTTLWAANALSSSLSAFDIKGDGVASLRNQTAFKDPSEGIFLSDVAVSSSGDQLLQLVGNRGEVMVFDIQENGDLVLNHTVGGLPALGTYGMLPM